MISKNPSTFWVRKSLLSGCSRRTSWTWWRRIAFLENRVEDLEPYTRINNIIVTGLQIKPRSYAGAVTGGDGEEQNEEEQLCGATGDSIPAIQRD